MGSDARSSPLQRGGRRDLAVDDPLLELVDLVENVLRHLVARLAERDALVLQVEDRVGPALERPLLHGLRRVVHGRVDALDRARQDVRPEVRLVAVDADAPLPLLLRGVERAEPAAAGDLEHDLRALRDLVERDLLALVLRDEVLRIRREDLDLRVARLCTGLVAGDEDVDRRELDPADRADHLLAACLLRDHRRHAADEVAVLVRRERQPLHVRVALERRRLHRVVDDREVRVGEALRGGVQGLCEQEPDRDRHVVALAGERRQVRHVVARLARLDAASGDSEFAFGALQSLERRLVERLVVEAPDVRDEPDLRACLFRRARAFTAAVPVVAAASGRREERDEGNERRRPPTSRHRLLQVSKSAEGGKCIPPSVLRPLKPAQSVFGGLILLLMINARSTFIRVMNFFGTRGLILPTATPAFLRLNTASTPPLYVPFFTASAVRKTEVSTRFTALVRM